MTSAATTKIPSQVGINVPAPGRAQCITQIAEVISHATSFLLVSHLDPDGDALGSMLAMDHYLRDLGKQVVSARDSVIPAKYEFLPGVENIVEASGLSADFTVDVVIVLECPEQTRMGSATRFLDSATHVIAIDHHHGNHMYGTINWVEPTASSVAEMLFNYFQATGYVLKQDVANCLYTGLLTDTGRFRYGSTSAESFRMAGALRDAGADIRGIVDQVYYQMPLSSLKMLGQVLSGMEYIEKNRICVLTLTNAIRTSTGATDGDSDGLAEYSLYTRGVEIGLIFKEGTDGAVKVSMRTYAQVDAQLIASQFGGGGHKNAAGCRIIGSLAHVKAQVIAAAKEALERIAREKH